LNFGEAGLGLTFFSTDNVCFSVLSLDDSRDKAATI